MRKNIENLLTELYNEIIELKQIAANQSKEIADLKKQLEAVSVVKIEERGERQTESYGNLILDEIVSVKNKLEILTKQNLQESASEKSENEFSLAELKQELIKLADMMTV